MCAEIVSPMRCLGGAESRSRYCRVGCAAMGAERLAVEFERRAEGDVLLRVTGKLERGTAALLEGVLQALWNDPAPVVLDLSRVDHIDSRGLDVLLTAESQAY